MHKRRLNELEYLVWTFGQPNNISMSIEFRGKFEREKLRKSLDLVQKKHPILQTQLVLKKNQPFFVWNLPRKIPLEINPRTDDNQYKKIVEEEFVTPFEIGSDVKDPLIRVKVLVSEERFDLILTLYHVIGDGISMAFLFRDLLRFYIKPPRKIKPLKIIKNTKNILPTSYQKKIPKRVIRFKIILFVLKFFLKIERIRYRILGRSSVKEKLRIVSPEDMKYRTHSWKLSEEQTSKFMDKCKKKNVSLHSAICTLLIEDFPIIENPVNLRNRLAYPVKDSIGYFAGGILILMKYKRKRSFWKNAKRYQRKLGKKLNSDKVFNIFKVIFRSVPREYIKRLFQVILELAGRAHPLTITNLGSIDKLNIIAASEDLEVISFYGGVSSTLNVVIATVFTIQHKMHFHLHYHKYTISKLRIRKYAKNALEKLESILND